MVKFDNLHLGKYKGIESDDEDLTPRTKARKKGMRERKNWSSCNYLLGYRCAILGVYLYFISN